MLEMRKWLTFPSQVKRKKAREVGSIVQRGNDKIFIISHNLIPELLDKYFYIQKTKTNMAYSIRILYEIILICVHMCSCVCAFNQNAKVIR